MKTSKLTPPSPLTSPAIALIAALLAVALTLQPQTTRAANYTWTAGGGSSSRAWDNGANWDTTPTFNANAAIIFYNSINLNGSIGASVLGNGDRTIGSLAFTANTSTNAMTLYLAGGVTESTALDRTLTLGSASVAPTITVDAASANHTIGVTRGSITLANDLTATVNGSATLTIARPIDGTGFGITKSGTGTLTLSGTNTYSGGTTNSAGTLQVNSSTALPSGSAVSISSGAQLNLNAAATFANNLTIYGTGTSPTVGAIILANNVNLSGPITLAGNSQIGCVGGSSTTSSTNSGRTTGGYGLTFNGAWNVNGATGTRTFVLANTGTANNYTGDTTLQNNFVSPATYTSPTTTYLKLGANEQIPNGATAGLLSFQNGNNANRAVCFELNGFNETINGLANAYSGAYTVIQNTSSGASVLSIGDADTASSFSGTIMDGGTGKTLAITKIGTGTLTLSGANTYSGGTIIANGTLLSSANGLGSGAVTATGNATLGATANGVTIPNNIAINPGVTLIGLTAASLNLTLAGNLTGSGTLQGSAGTTPWRLFLSGDNSGFTGTVESQTSKDSLQFMNASASLPGGTLVMSSSVAVELDAAGTYSFGTVTDTGGAGVTTTASGAHTLSIGGNNNASSITGVIKDGTGKIALTKAGDGTLTLSAINIYTGDTAISAGTLALSGSGSIANTPSITVAGGATFDVSGLSSPPFALGASQTLANSGASTANIVGNISTGSGTNSQTYSSGTPSFTAAGTLTLAPGTTLMINNTGAQLSHGSHKLIAKTGSGSVTGTLPTNYSVSGGGAATPNYLWLSGGELYLAVNNTPVARNVTNSVTQGGVAAIPFNLGKYALATDVDDDSLTITSVSAGLGNVGTDGSSINYTNTGGSAGTFDSIAFTVSDGFGGTATANIAILISSATGANLVSATAAGGNAYLAYAGIPGTNYVLDWSTNVYQQVWLPVCTNQANDVGSLRFTNAISSYPTNDFYRTRALP